MGACRWAAILAVLMLPCVAGAKGEKHEDDLNEKGVRASEGARRVDPGWAKRSVWHHTQALGLKGKVPGLGHVKRLFGERRDRGARWNGSARGEDRGFMGIIQRLEAATLGRKKIAGHALGEQVHDQVRETRVLPVKSSTD